MTINQQDLAHLLLVAGLPGDVKNLIGSKICVEMECDNSMPEIGEYIVSTIASVNFYRGASDLDNQKASPDEGLYTKLALTLASGQRQGKSVVLYISYRKGKKWTARLISYDRVSGAIMEWSVPAEVTIL